MSHMIYSPLIDKLIDALQCLPGIGPKSAQRLVFHLLERNRHGGLSIAKALEQAMIEVKNCQRCQNLCETDICHICQNPRRDQHFLCVTESPADVIAIEQTARFSGLYFVLGGHLSPIDGIGPQEIGIDKLQLRLQEKNLTEMILATNPTVEGEATAHYIAELAKQYGIKTSRIAYGVPVGGELEYLDGGTLARAIEGRGIY